MFVLKPDEYSKLNGSAEKVAVPSSVPVSYAETKETFFINVRWRDQLICTAVPIKSDSQLSSLQ